MTRKQPTFSEVADLWLKAENAAYQRKHGRGWSAAEVHAIRHVMGQFERVFGNKPIAQVTRADVMAALADLENSYTEEKFLATVKQLLSID